MFAALFRGRELRTIRKHISRDEAKPSDAFRIAESLTIPKEMVIYGYQSVNQVRAIKIPLPCNVTFVDPITVAVSNRDLSR